VPVEAKRCRLLAGLGKIPYVKIQMFSAFHTHWQPKHKHSHNTEFNLYSVFRVYVDEAFWVHLEMMSIQSGMQSGTAPRGKETLFDPMETELNDELPPPKRAPLTFL